MTMNLVENGAESDGLIVGLYRAKDGSMRVRSIEIVNGDMRNRYSFRSGRPLSEVFSDGFAASVAASVERMGAEEMVLAEPDYLHSEAGLVLSGLRILSSGPDDGLEPIVLRFHQYIGAIKQVLRFEDSMTLPSATVRERIAVEVLQDVISPVFDMLSLSRATSREQLASHGDAIGKRLDRLLAQEEEIKFYAGLLQRYVAGCQQDAAAATPEPVAANDVPDAHATSGT